MTTARRPRKDVSIPDRDLSSSELVDTFFSRISELGFNP